jgi:hypothetical protein
MVNPNRFYTYAYLREDRTPYYIGKGSGNRLYTKCKREFKPPKDKSRIIFLKQKLTEQEAFKHEKYMIAVFGRKDLGTGILHNKTDGGEGGSGAVRSEETRNKISEKNKGENHPNYGKSLPIETKKKQSKAKQNKKHWNDGCGNHIRSIECPGEGWFCGMTEETRKKMSENNRGETNSQSKWWEITFLDGTTIIKCGLSIWAKENGYNESHIRSVSSGKLKKHKDIIKVVILK